MTRHFLCFIFLLASLRAIAQIDDCESKLNQATDEFNAGHFYGIAAMLKPCIDNGFSREQRQRAYLLLTQTYLLLDDPIGAESSYLSLLKANPEFETDPERDPIDVVYLSKKFTATPVFTLFGKLGINTSPVRVIAAQSLTGKPVDTKYILKPGWMIGIGADWNATEKISLALELQYAFTAYRKQQYNIFGLSETDLYDRQNWVMLPLSLKYSFSTGKFKPYGYFGYSVNLLLNDKANMTFIDRIATSGEGTPLQTQSESPILNLRYKRELFNASFFVGGGVRYKWGLEYLFVDVRYAFGMKDLLKESGAYLDYKASADRTSPVLLESGSPVFKWANIDDNFRLDNVYVTFGYMHPLYNPRKLKKARTRSVLRTIRAHE